MTRDEIEDLYRRYIDCLNSQDWDRLHHFVAENVNYNGNEIGLKGYREMLVGDFSAIPDLFFSIRRLVCEPPMVACGLAFDCTPVGILFGMAVNGARVRFDENVFYEIRDGKIAHVWSVIDKAAITAQLAAGSDRQSRDPAVRPAQRD